MAGEHGMGPLEGKSTTRCTPARVLGSTKRMFGIGTMLTGKVDQLDGEFIQTRFFAIGVPLVPMGSVFVMREGRHTIRIPLNAKSVVWAYIRWFAFMGAVAAAANVLRGTWPWQAAVAMAALWAAVTFSLTPSPYKTCSPDARYSSAATGISALPTCCRASWRSRCWSRSSATLRSRTWRGRSPPPASGSRLVGDPEALRLAERAWHSWVPRVVRPTNTPRQARAGRLPVKLVNEEGRLRYTSKRVGPLGYSLGRRRRVCPARRARVA